MALLVPIRLLPVAASLAQSPPAPPAQAPEPPTPSSRLDAMERELDALRRKAREQDEQIEQLKAQNGEAWLTEQRAEQVRTVVRDVLADTQTRTALESSGATAGYDRNFFIASADGNFRLNIEGQIQSRFSYSNLPRAAIKPVTPPANPDYSQIENEYGFELRRVKLNFFGNLFDPTWTYRVQFAYDRDSANSNRPLAFEDTYVQKALGDGLFVRMGQWKSIFNYENNTSSRTQQFVERSLVNLYYSQAFIQGALLGWESGSVRLYGSYNDGGGNANLAEVQASGNPTEWALSGRADWKLAGAWGQFKDMQGWRGSPFAAMVGAGVNWQRSGGNAPAGRQVVGNGTVIPATSSAAAVNAQLSLLTYTADLNLRGDGWSVWGAYLGNWLYNGGSVAAAAGVEDSISHGAVLQGGVFLADALEVILRYEGLWVLSSRTFTAANALNAQTLNLVTVGGNWYFNKNANKLTVDIGYAFNPVQFTTGLFGEAISGADWRATQTGAGSGEVVARVQMQLLF